VENIATEPNSGSVSGRLENRNNGNAGEPLSGNWCRLGPSTGSISACWVRVYMHPGNFSRLYAQFCNSLHCTLAGKWCAMLSVISSNNGNDVPMRFPSKWPPQVSVSVTLWTIGLLHRSRIFATKQIDSIWWSTVNVGEMSAVHTVTVDAVISVAVRTSLMMPTVYVFYSVAQKNNYLPLCIGLYIEMLAYITFLNPWPIYYCDYWKKLNKMSVWLNRTYISSFTERSFNIVSNRQRPTI